jgi:hypothetical protein
MLIVGLFIILAILTYSDKSKIVDAIIIIIALCFLSIIFSHRSSDFPVYKTFFTKVEPLNRVIMGDSYVFTHITQNYEIGYKLINSFLRIFTDHMEIMYFLFNIFILFTILKIFSENSSNFFLLLLPYFTFMLITVQVGIIRQMIAITIFLLSIQYIKKRELLKFLACTALAFCFHRTAIILPVFYFVTYKEYSNWLLMSLLIVGLLIFLEIIPFHPVSIVEWLSEHIKIASVQVKLNWYIWQTKTLPIPEKFTRGIFENVGMYLLLLYIKSDLNKKQLYDKFINISLNLALIYILIYIYFFDISSFSYRLNYYLIIFKFFVLAKFIESLEIQNNKFIAKTLLIVYCGLMMIIRIQQGF